jgi:hypothetical protein
MIIRSRHVCFLISIEIGRYKCIVTYFEKDIVETKTPLPSPIARKRIGPARKM